MGILAGVGGGVVLVGGAIAVIAGNGNCSFGRFIYIYSFDFISYSGSLCQIWQTVDASTETCFD
jgi:ABC-type bacteriocin/lantibiotic exporter with double-glycine peptidase domain